MIASRSRRFVLLGFWILPAAVATLGLRLVPSRLNPDLSLVAILASQLFIWLPWGLWATLIVWVGERVPLERGNVLRAVLVHLALSPVIIGAQILVIWRVSIAFGMNEPRELDSMLIIGLRQYGDLLMVVYWAVVGTHVGIRWHERWQEEVLRATRLREDLAQANLQALRAQLNPHFLFNAMNSVVTLIARDANAARDMLVKLAELLRATLAAGDAQETTLAQELELTSRYLELEQVRFADRLTVEWSIESDLGAWRVPAFALQPLVENALRHGLANRSEPGTVLVSARSDDLALELMVRDDGPGASTSLRVEKNGTGTALNNLRARLTRLYGTDATLTLRSRPEGGTDALVRIPRKIVT